MSTCTGMDLHGLLCWLRDQTESFTLRLTPESFEIDLRWPGARHTMRIVTDTCEFSVYDHEKTLLAYFPTLIGLLVWLHALAGFFPKPSVVIVPDVPVPPLVIIDTRFGGVTVRTAKCMILNGELGISVAQVVTLAEALGAVVEVIPNPMSNPMLDPTSGSRSVTP